MNRDAFTAPWDNVMVSIARDFPNSAVINFSGKNVNSSNKLFTFLKAKEYVATMYLSLLISNDLYDDMCLFFLMVKETESKRLIRLF